MQSIPKQKNRSNRLKSTNFLKWSILGFFTALILSTWQCASIQRPSGGPKDSIPPKILNETPPNLTRNFDAEKIVIQFDEFIKLTNEFKEVSVSPDMERMPVSKVKRRNLEITLPDSLEENTTYTINFGKAIVDFNEGNQLFNYSYVFSTGDVIDSLSVSGNVRNAFTKEVEKEITVMLIPTRQDSIFGKRKANIFTTTDTAGNFRMTNLREDTYRIYALKETNNDRIYNSPDEYIGFLKDSIVLTGDTSGVNLEIFREIPKTFRLLDRSIESNGRVSFVFNKPLENPDIIIRHPESLNADKIVEFRPSKDSATVWLADLSFDSLKVHFLENGKLLDSITMRRGRNDKYDRDFLITDNLERNRVNRVKHLQLRPSSPIRAFDRSRIVLTEDSVARTNYQLVRDTTKARQYIIRYNWRPKRNYQLDLQEGAFTGFFNDKNKPQTLNFTFDDAENYGDILLNFIVPDTGKQYIVELINEKKDVVFKTVTITGNQTIPFRQFPSGRYSIRIIYDENKNNKWDTGNVEKKQQPERIWYTGSTFIIRANWEQSDNINIPK